MIDTMDTRTRDMFAEAGIEWTNPIEDVAAFHYKFGLDYNGPPRNLEQAELQFRFNFLREETDEVLNALIEGDLAQVGGELADLVWVALGIALRMGIPFEEHWAEIRRANMSKERASAENPGKRGSTIDIVKPAGWVPPNHEAVLHKHQQDVFGYI